MKNLKVTWKGTTPLIMHSCQCVNPLHPIAKELKKYTSKRNKTEEDLIKISDLEWESGAYWKDGLGLYIPAENVEATVYNAVPEQCDEDPLYTASMFRLNLDDVYSHKIIAMEKTFMKSLGLKYGDVVKVEGTGKWDGVWQIQDTMNPRFAGQKKIDFLVPEDIKTGKWNTVKLYSLTDKENTDIYKNNMAPQAKMKRS
jgi:hypothetical protein